MVSINNKVTGTYSGRQQLCHLSWFPLSLGLFIQAETAAAAVVRFQLVMRSRGRRGRLSGSFWATGSESYKELDYTEQG